MAFKRTNGRKCRFESLENRRMMAGLVTARVSGGTLEVKGDFFSNAITITPGALPFEVKVTGINDNNLLPTTVNGVVNGAITFKNVIHGMSVNLGDGNNILNVNGVSIFGKVNLKTGKGVDAGLWIGGINVNGIG